MNNDPKAAAERFKPFLSPSTGGAGGGGTSGQLSRMPSPSPGVGVGPGAVAVSAAAEFKSLQARMAPSATAPCTAPAGSMPTVTLERSNGVVTAVRIECSCGQVVELSCVYDG